MKWGNGETHEISLIPLIGINREELQIRQIRHLAWLSSENEIQCGVVAKGTVPVSLECGVQIQPQP